MIDWKNPDYSAVFAERAERLQYLRADKTGERWKGVRAYYRDHQADLINDWGCTFDPRLADRGLPTVVPFLLFDKQREWVDWVLRQWRAQESCLTEKSRDAGVSWLAVALACGLCTTHDSLAIGFGSRKEEYVDKSGSPKALFWKAREYMTLLPPELRGGWRRGDDAHLRISFGATGSVITGEAGDNIGRGDRATLYVTDEDAFIERPHLVEQSLSQTTNCRVSISTPKGMANPFAEKRFKYDPHRVFIFDWRDDPRKDEAWYAKQKRDLDAVTVAQEIDRSYTASVVGIVIPQEWVQACVDLHVKLGFEPRGARRGALDVADEGLDLNAFCDATGVLVNSVVAWSGKGSDTFATAQRAFALCDVLGLEGFDYDADGLGAGIRGDARVINEGRTRKLDVRPYRGSGGVAHPDKPIPDAAPRTERKTPDAIARLNADYFENAKAQAWFTVRAMCQRGHRALEMHERGEDWRAAYAPDDLISFNSKMAELSTVTQQLSQATYTQSKAGKIMIDKAPDSARSPNHADAVVIRYAPGGRKKRYDPRAWTS